MPRSDYKPQGLRRTKAEMLILDTRIQDLYRKGLGCRKIGAQLGLHHAIVYKRLRRFGLTRSPPGSGDALIEWAPGKFILAAIFLFAALADSDKPAKRGRPRIRIDPPRPDTRTGLNLKPGTPRSRL